MKRKLVAAAAVALMASPLCGARAAETDSSGCGLTFSAGADVVSSYVWRGAHLSGVSVQPAMALAWKGLSLGTWGSVDVLGLYKELDFTLAYTIAGVELAVTDYWVGTEKEFSYFGKVPRVAGDPELITPHVFEATLAYTLPLEKFPLRIAWSTAFAGKDFKLTEAGDVERAFSSYAELSLPFSIKTVNLNVAVGIRPFEAPFYAAPNAPAWYDTDLAVTSISLKAAKEIRITDSYALPLFAQLIFNPNAEDAFLVVGLHF